MAESAYGIVQRLTEPDYNDGSTSQLAINSLGHQLVTNGLPTKTARVLRGGSWTATIPTASAFTNVAAMPTTRAELALYNGEPSTGKSYVIDQISFLSLTSITALSNATLIFQVAQVAALTDNTAILINGVTGRSYVGRALRALAVTTMTANKWTPIASGTNSATASIGFGIVAEVYGGIIVPPGFTLGVNAVVGTATGTSLMGISWHEVQLPIG